MISFKVDSEATARKLLESVKLIAYAESLGGVESLITYPMLQTHGDLPVEIREKLGITEDFLRLSVGIENADDLIADLEQALAQEDAQMKFDFDKVVDRHGTKCLKYDFAKERGRSDDMLPLLSLIHI